LMKQQRKSIILNNKCTELKCSHKYHPISHTGHHYV
jgi:hypothetical protein